MLHHARTSPLVRRVVALLRRMAPPCLGCGERPVDTAQSICDDCRRRSGVTVGWIERHIRAGDDSIPLYAFGSYGAPGGGGTTPLAIMLRRFKYGGDRCAGRALAGLLRAAPRLAPLEGRTLVPIPLHPHRLRTRGFNQAAWLARALAEGNCARLRPDALRRTRDDAPQAGQAAERRRSLLATTFRAGPRHADSGVVLVDDVHTTGTTLRLAAAALLAAGIDVEAAVVLLLAERPRNVDTRTQKGIPP